MPLLLLAASLYSTLTLKSVNFSLDTRLLAGGLALLITPSSITQPSGRFGICPMNASSDVPSNSALCLPYVCLPLSFAAVHLGGRTHILVTWRFTLGSAVRDCAPSIVLQVMYD